MKRWLLVVVVTTMAAACQGVQDEPFTLIVEPEFVQGVIPGQRLVMLVTIEDTSSDAPEAEVTAVAAGGQVSVDPQSIGVGEVAEVTYIADPVAGEQEVPMTMTITATRGSVVHEHEVATVVVPWEDSLAITASEILALYRPWLAETHPELGIESDTELDGTFVAPNLLVVSHYAFFNEDWEVGVAWHIMTAPDDWAEIYLRPRDEISPSTAFRLNSWSTALGGGAFEIEEVPAPDQVVR